jgi:hypothetical protein
MVQSGQCVIVARRFVNGSLVPINDCTVAPDIANQRVNLVGNCSGDLVVSCDSGRTQDGVGVSSPPNGSFLSDLTASPSTSVVAGEQVVITATVEDLTLVQSVRWSASGGTLNPDTGLMAHWAAPRGLTEITDETVTLQITQLSGTVTQKNIVLHVFPDSATLNGARITSITAEPSIVQPGGLVTLTASVANAQEVLSIQWTASIGTLLSDQGYSVKWRAPTVLQHDTEAVLTVTTLGQNADVHAAQVKVLIQAENRAADAQIVDAYAHLIAAVQAEDIDALMRLVSPDYLQGGTDYNGFQASFESFFRNYKRVQMIVNIDAIYFDNALDPHLAHVRFEQCITGFNPATQATEVIDDENRTMSWRNESGVWRMLGDQKGKP